MISTLNALLSRAFVVGYILPTLAFFIGLSLLFPTAPIFTRLDTILSGDMAASGVALAVLAIWMCALVVSIFNVPAYRILEGYVWPIRNFSRWKNSEKDRKKILERNYDEILIKLKEDKIADSFLLYSQAQFILAKLRTDFPQNDGDLLPTRLGNVIRAFERYPNVIYGADGVALWPSIEAAMTDGERYIVENAKSNTDLFVNLCLFSFFFGIISIVKYIWIFFGDLIDIYKNNIDINTFCEMSFQGGYLLFLSGIGFFLCALSYRIAVKMARNWGRRVRVAFDLNLQTLAERMGYEVPIDFDGKQDYWQSISQQILYIDEQAARSIASNRKTNKNT